MFVSHILTCRSNLKCQIVCYAKPSRKVFMGTALTRAVTFKKILGMWLNGLT